MWLKRDNMNYIIDKKVNFTENIPTWSVIEYSVLIFDTVDHFDTWINYPKETDIIAQTYIHIHIPWYST